MKVQLTIHLEPLNDRLVWWADSPDVPGFSAMDETLQRLLNRAQWALEEELETPPVFHYELVSEPQSDIQGELTIANQPPQMEAPEVRVVTRSTEARLSAV